MAVSSPDSLWQSAEHHLAAPQLRTFHWYIAEALWRTYNPVTACDLGCGAGFVVERLRALGVDARGVDLSAYAISRAPETTRPYLAQIDLETDHAPLEPQSQDLVTCLEVLEHLHNPSRVIDEMRRLTKPRGIIFVTTPTHFSNHRLVRILQGQPGINTTHIGVRPRCQWIRMFEESGFLYRGPTTPTMRDRWRRVCPAGLIFRVTATLAKIPLSGYAYPTLAGWFVFQKTG